MRNIVKKAAVFVAVLVFSYLAWAFAAWELNPGKWDFLSRIFMVFLGSVGGACAVAELEYKGAI